MELGRVGCWHHWLAPKQAVSLHVTPVRASTTRSSTSKHDAVARSTTGNADTDGVSHRQAAPVSTEWENLVPSVGWVRLIMQETIGSTVCVCVCVCVCVRARARACVRACVLGMVGARARNRMALLV